MKKIFFILILFLISCQLPDNNTEYQEGLVVFGRIELFEKNGIAIGDIGIVRVSLSSEIDANIGNTEALYINDAEVSITGPFGFIDNQIDSTINLISLDTLGQYAVLDTDTTIYKIWPNSNYTLNVDYYNYSASGTTTTPSYLQISSISDTYTCEQCSDPTIYGQTTCGNSGENWTSESQDIELINVNNFDSISLATGWKLGDDTSVLDQYIIGSEPMISSIELSRYGCNVGSFASKPYFVLEIDDYEEEVENPNLSAIRILSYALEDKELGLEPYEDLNTNGQWDLNDCFKGGYCNDMNFLNEEDCLAIDEDEDGSPDNTWIVLPLMCEEDDNWIPELGDGLCGTYQEEICEPFFDYNQNLKVDNTLINTFYDTTDVFKIWKGTYLRDENYNPYLENPFLWTVETSPSPIMWLYFNYYGKHLMVIQASDDAYYDYLSGDPLGQNQYVLPDSNIEGGYGLFTSNYSKAFFININKAD